MPALLTSTSQRAELAVDGVGELVAVGPLADVAGDRQRAPAGGGSDLVGRGLGRRPACGSR